MVEEKLNRLKQDILAAIVNVDLNVSQIFSKKSASGTNASSPEGLLVTELDSLKLKCETAFAIPNEILRDWMVQLDLTLNSLTRAASDNETHACYDRIRSAYLTFERIISKRALSKISLNSMIP